MQEWWVKFKNTNLETIRLTLKEGDHEGIFSLKFLDLTKRLVTIQEPRVNMTGIYRVHIINS